MICNTSEVSQILAANMFVAFNEYPQLILPILGRPRLVHVQGNDLGSRAPKRCRQQPPIDADNTLECAQPIHIDVQRAPPTDVAHATAS